MHYTSYKILAAAICTSFSHERGISSLASSKQDDIKVYPSWEQIKTLFWYKYLERNKRFCTSCADDCLGDEYHLSSIIDNRKEIEFDVMFCLSLNNMACVGSLFWLLVSFMFVKRSCCCSHLVRLCKDFLNCDREFKFTDKHVDGYRCDSILIREGTSHNGFLVWMCSYEWSENTVSSSLLIHTWTELSCSLHSEQQSTWCPLISIWRQAVQRTATDTIPNTSSSLCFY